jgi:phosphatidylglycerol---prolipoprotein diacylglyceryl transferase
MLASIHWNPPRTAFHIPYIQHPVAWYGICFVCGFFLGYFIMLALFNHYLSLNPFKPLSATQNSANDLSRFLTDRLCWFVVAGTIIGARLGAVFFYDWTYYSQHPIEILKTWKGGLASHGGALGVLLAVYLFWLYSKRWLPEFRLLNLLDMIAIPVPLAGFFIRFGNFINQEILGTPSDLPWAVVFGDPADYSNLIPRHPVQLYEGIAYLTIFFLLVYLWQKKGALLKTGTLFGWMFTLLFSSRFILEFWKTDQGSSLSHHYFQMGQWLSLPFIAAGILILIFRNKFENKPLHLL